MPSKISIEDLENTSNDEQASGKTKPVFERTRSTYYYGRPSPFLSNLLFLLNPAPDNMIASNIMSLFEISLGLSLFRLGMRIPIQNFSKRWSTRIKRFASLGVSGHLIFCGGAQMLSNQLNEDDTVLGADARRQRIRLLINDEPVSWWFGPKYYEYMSSKELLYLLNRGHMETNTLLKAEGDKIIHKGQTLSLENDNYLKKEVLPSLKNALVTIEKPPLNLSQLQIDKDDQDLDYIWFELVNPWEELWQEVNLSINFVPKWNFIEENDEAANGENSSLLQPIVALDD